MSTAKRSERGPFQADQLRSKDCYELSGGHPIYCAPTGGRGGLSNGVGFGVLIPHPAVESAGIDTGFSPEPGMLRAPDIAVGNVPNEPGWVKGVPPLAVEYADVGQEEAELQTKITHFLAHGTKWVWVVRLKGARFVEVHERGRPMRRVHPGEELTAPGILQNPVAVEALYDREAAHEAVLRNLLQRRGFASLDEVREEGREEGREALRDALVVAYELAAVELPKERREQLDTLDLAGLRALLDELRTKRARP